MFTMLFTDEIDKDINNDDDNNKKLGVVGVVEENCLSVGTPK